jgi:glycerol uptake facilitator-like aquaporin
MISLKKRLAAEAIASFFLFATVIGSGIMAARLAEGNIAVAMLGNSLATGAILFVLLTMLAPISGAHMNPVVSLVAAARRELSWRDAAAYMLTQLAFGMIGAWAANLMFEAEVLQASAKLRTGLGQWLGEAIATFGLILTIMGTLKYRLERIPESVALYVVAAFWFTSSSFANPAITVARSFFGGFAGIDPAYVPILVVAQLSGAALAVLAGRWLLDGE